MEMFQGKNGYFWWFGTVEDNGDPMGLGRCRVRIAGWHNPDYNELPVTSLPWAYPITSLSNAGVSGIGSSPLGPVPGTRVFGFFLDGEQGQQPMMTGTVPGETNVEHMRATPFGSVPFIPSSEPLLRTNESHKQEGDNSAGYEDNTTSSTVFVPDQRFIGDLGSGDWILPFSGFVSSAYAEARGSSRHSGVDICPAGFFEQTSPGAKHLNGRMKGPTGLPVLAAAEGTVVKIWKSDVGNGGIFSDYDKVGPGSSGGIRDRRRSYGNAIAIQHDLSSGTYITIYAHLGVSQDPGVDRPGSGINVNFGDKVSKGQVIGSVGRSHVWDSLTHLHFEIRQGSALPRSNNHFNPGRIFPQLFTRHSSFRSAVDNAIKYNTQLGFNKLDMPVIAGEGPK